VGPSAIRPELGIGLLMVLGYAVAQRVFVRRPSPVLHPVFVSTCVALVALRACGLNVEADRPSEALALALLGPVSVALVVPIYANRATLRAAGLPLLVGAVSGCLASIAAVISIAELAQLQASVLRALAVKSVTTPIAVELVARW
jgi:putative effector of murein hydrolase